MKRFLPFSLVLLLTGLSIWMRAGAHGPGGSSMSDTPPANPLVSANPVTNIALFVAPFVKPSNAVPASVSPEGYLIYDIRMRTNLHTFHPDLPAVPIWGYSDSPDRLGGSPGPTIQATSGVPVIVRWINELPSQYPDWIPADTNNHAVPNQDVRNVVHLHGGANRPLFDGHPTYWFRPGVTTNYFYDNIDLSHGADGETLWYHDHAIGVTANNVYAGLSGMYLLRNPEFEASLNLPSGDYEVPLIFQDRDIQIELDPPTLLSDVICTNVNPWHYLPVVNGVIAPYFEVEPRRYRFRILNGCSFRTIGLVLVTDVAGQPGVTTNVPMYQIGTDDGFLDAPVQIPLTSGGFLPALRLMPGARADVIVDFTDWKGYSNIVVANSFDAGNFGVPPGPPENVVGGAFMQFRVGQTTSGPDTSSIPSVIYTNSITAEELATQAVRTRRITLDLTIESPFPGMLFDQDHHLFAILNMMNFDAPVTENPRAGDVEIWEFINLTGASHPMHVHLLDFMVVNRIRFRDFNPSQPSYVPGGVANYILDRQAGNLRDLSYYLAQGAGSTNPPQVNERGPKDVVHAAPGAVTRIVMRWPTNEIFQGPYVFHCHILDHEDNDMMRPIEVRPPLQADSLFTSFDPLQRTFSIELGTRTNLTYNILASSDLKAWQPLTNTLGTGMTFYATDTNAYLKGQPTPLGAPTNPDTGAPSRFYRATAYP